MGASSSLVPARLTRGSKHKIRRTDLIDLTGQKFGKWTVLKYDHYGDRMTWWLCRCECGTERPVRTRGLRSGRSRSCGHCGRASRLMPYGEAARKSLYGTYILGAKKRGLEFSLSLKEFSTITTRNCHYCGVAPKQVYAHKQRKGKTTPYIYNGIDRVDNTKGYTKKNSIPCCKVCNRAKSAMTKKEFIAWLDQLVKFRTRVKGPVKTGGKIKTKCLNTKKRRSKARTP